LQLQTVAQNLTFFGNAVCLLAVLFYDFAGGKAACVL